ncbi:MAG: hypothetical protein QMC80_05380 [Thermoplasmatales archaeon]|nr:hypothetical protein [Thermoplasmatales archaeon]
MDMFKYNDVIRVFGEENMDEPLCSIEIVKRGNGFVAKVQTQLGGQREFRGSAFEEMLEQLVIELQEEFASL